MSIETIEYIRSIYQTDDFIPLHVPSFDGNEANYVQQTIESTFVSSVGKFVDDFERKIEEYTASPKAVAIVNGTSALHTALHVAGVKQNDLVITQPLTFVATCNVIHHMGAFPVFVDVSAKSMGLCPNALRVYLEEFAELDGGACIHKDTGQYIKAVVPMHTFGHPVELDEIVAICKEWNLVLVEDAAESLGSFYKGKHTGTFGELSALSFNGNKIITTGGGGIVLAASEETGERVKHLTTTAKVAHPFEYYHDEAGFNYRMPNLNAALGCAQMEVLQNFVAQKRALASSYAEFFEGSEYQFVLEPEYAESNYWLNAVLCQDEKHRDAFLKSTNESGIMTRPVWCLMNKLPMFKNALKGDLSQAEFFAQRLVNIPSSPIQI